MTEMDRLTNFKNGVCVYTGPGCKYPETGEIPAEMEIASVKAVLARLSEYEDTGLTPEEIAGPISLSNDPLTQRVLDIVGGERERQDALWGDQSGNSLFEWVSILGEEYGEFCEAVNETCFKNPAHPERGGFRSIVKEAVQIAAVAVAIIEAVYHRRPEKDGGNGF